MTLPKSLLSWLLWKANAHAKGQHAFYRLKDELLHASGTLLPETDIQRIHKQCWTCYGSGRFTFYDSGWDTCRRCDGSGIWDTHFVELERWELAGRIFHRPINKEWDEDRHWVPKRAPTIFGLIQHGHTSRECAAECRLWLLLLYDRSALRQELSRSGYHQPTWYPLSMLQRALWLRKHKYRPFSLYGGKCEICFKPKFWRSERFCFSCVYERAWNANYPYGIEEQEYDVFLPEDDDVPF